jgi:hypothetical protein
MDMTALPLLLHAGSETQLMAEAAHPADLIIDFIIDFVIDLIAAHITGPITGPITAAHIGSPNASSRIMQSLSPRAALLYYLHHTYVTLSHN